MSALGGNLNNNNGNNDDGLPGDDEPDNLLTCVQGSRGSVPTTCRSLGTFPSLQAELEQEATSVVRSTEQVGRLSFFHMAGDSSDVRWGSGSCQQDLLAATQRTQVVLQQKEVRLTE
jgi:hypothetical protein